MKYYEDSSKKFFEIHIRLNVISIGGNKKSYQTIALELSLNKCLFKNDSFFFSVGF